MILEPKKIKFVTVSTLTGWQDLSFLNTEFKASLFTLLFHPHQEVSLQFLPLEWYHCISEVVGISYRNLDSSF